MQLPYTTLLVSALLAIPSVADVLVVDDVPGVGVDFTGIQAAIDAAADGDTILVRGGQYPGFEIDGMSLTIVRDANGEIIGSGVRVDFAHVRNLGVGQQVVLRGLSIGPDSLQDAPLILEDNAGPIWVEDCTTGGGLLTSNGGAIVTACSDVTFSGCAIAATDGLFFFSGFYPGREGLRVSDSNVYAFDTVFRGGIGSTASETVPAGPGGDGLRMSGSQLWLSGCTVQGGGGGSGYEDFFGGGCLQVGALGGKGLVIEALPAVIRERGTTFAGGSENSYPCFIFPLSVGAPISGTPGFLSHLPGDARSLTSSYPVREGEALEFTFGAPAGELAFVAISLLHDPQWQPAFQGTLLSPLLSYTVLAAGSVPASGELLFSLTAPNVNPPFEALTFYAQSIFIGPGIASVGGGTQVTLVDSAF